MRESNGHTYPHPRSGHTSLFLVRHGRTASNVSQILHGRTDVPLDDHGVTQAEHVARRLAHVGKIDALVTSHLLRAHMTATAIGAMLGIAPRIETGLSEMDFGDFEGLTFERVAQLDPDLVVRFLDLDDHEAGWPGGESRQQFHARVRSTFSRILHDFGDGQRVIVVAHGGVIGSFLAQIHGASPNDWQAYQISNCSITHLEIAIDGSKLHYLNDTNHLEAMEIAAVEELAT